MKNLILLFIFFVSSLFSLSVEEIESQIFSSEENLREIGIVPFSEREILKYKILWSGIPAGESVMSCIPEVVGNRRVYRITTKTTSNKTVDLIYRVRNETESYLDYKGFYTLKFFSSQNEPGYKRKESVLFNHKENFYYLLPENTTGYIPQYVLDVVGALYYLRTQKLKVGEKYVMDVYSGKIVYPLVVSVLGEEEIKIEDKNYTCFKVEPKVDLKKFPLFRAKGKLYVWITKDEKKLPVKLKSKIFIGSVYAELVEKN